MFFSEMIKKIMETLRGISRIEKGKFTPQSINGIQPAGDRFKRIMKYSADTIKKKRQLWKNIAIRVENIRNEAAEVRPELT